MTELIIIVSRFPPTPAAGFCNALNVHRSAVFSCLCSDWCHWHTDVKKYEAKKKKNHTEVKKKTTTLDLAR